MWVRQYCRSCHRSPQVPTSEPRDQFWKLARRSCSWILLLIEYFSKACETVFLIREMAAASPASGNRIHKRDPCANSCQILKECESLCRAAHRQPPSATD